MYMYSFEKDLISLTLCGRRIKACEEAVTRPCQQAHTPKLQCSWPVRLSTSSRWFLQPVGLLYPVTTRRGNRVILAKINKSNFFRKTANNNHKKVWWQKPQSNNASVKGKRAKLVDIFNRLKPDFTAFDRILWREDNAGTEAYYLNG